MWKKTKARKAISERSSLARFLGYHEEKWDWDLRELERRLGVREVGEHRSGSEADTMLRIRVRSCRRGVEIWKNVISDWNKQEYVFGWLALSNCYGGAKWVKSSITDKWISSFLFFSFLSWASRIPPNSIPSLPIFDLPWNVSNYFLHNVSVSLMLLSIITRLISYGSTSVKPLLKKRFQWNLVMCFFSLLFLKC